VNKKTSVRFVIFVSAVLIFAFLLSACGAKTPDPRLPTPFTHNPGAAFTVNIKGDDTRRMVKCTLMFEVIDEAAVNEVAQYNYAIRNAVIIALSELTLEELTTDRDLKEISQKIVTQVNGSLRSHIDLIVGAYFTDFAVA